MPGVAAICRVDQLSLLPSSSCCAVCGVNATRVAPARDDAVPHRTMPVTCPGKVLPETTTPTLAPTGMENFSALCLSMTTSSAAAGALPLPRCRALGGPSPIHAVPRLGAPPLTTALPL